MSTNELNPAMFGGDPLWPKGQHPFRAEFSLSCGWVIVDPDGRESMLGFASERQAKDVAMLMTYGYRQGALLRPDREKMLREVAAALGVADSLDIATCNVMLHQIDSLKANQRFSDARPPEVEPAPGVDARTDDGRFIGGTGYGGERR